LQSSKTTQFLTFGGRTKANRKIETPFQNCRTLMLQKLRITRNDTMIWQWNNKGAARFGTEEFDG
jgi:hypothetical protein